MTPGPSRNKSKHPNQYTYRPRPPSSTNQAPPAIPSPARKGIQGGTPVPVLPPPPPPPPPPPAQHEHGTRRAGAIANGTIPPPPTTYSVHNLHWHLPDHLLSFSDLLPTPTPIAVEVRSPRVLSFLPKNHFHNQTYGPFLEDRDEQGNLVLPGDQPTREAIGSSTTHLEPPARIRYPAKRITRAEIRKRLRNVLDYMTRVHVEERKRKERAKLLGIKVESLPTRAKIDEQGDVNMEEAIADEPTQEIEAKPPKPDPPNSTQILSDLTRDLIDFQFNLAQGGFASPFPPPIPTFPNLTPVTPTFPSGFTMSQGESRLSAVDEVGRGEDAVEQTGHCESIDVYREGKADPVITEEIEQQAADLSRSHSGTSDGMRT